MLRIFAKEKINEFLKVHYSPDVRISVYCWPVANSLTNMVVGLSVLHSKTDKCHDFDLQEFASDSSAFSFRDFCMDEINSYIKNQKSDYKMKYDPKVLYHFFGFDPARNNAALLAAADPYLELLKKATNEGRNNQLILVSVQLELLAAQAGANNFSKDDLIAALEKLATQYTEQANKSRVTNK